jgi:hypothetical protein
MTPEPTRQVCTIATMTAGASQQRARQRRERLLETAYRLFSQHGTRAVGVDRIIAESGVAKMTSIATSRRGRAHPGLPRAP